MTSVNSISIAVYFLDAQDAAQAVLFEGSSGDVLGQALARVEQLRAAGMRHVCLSTENAQNVGKPGVAAVEGGKMPDGTDYGWTKRRRR